LDFILVLIGLFWIIRLGVHHVELLHLF